MARTHVLFVSLCVVLLWTLIEGVPAARGEMVITFSKDIRLLPANPNSKTQVKIQLSVNKTSVKPGDTVEVSFETDRDVYLTLMDVGTSGKITRLWPNELSGQDNLVKAGQRYTFPSQTDQFRFTAAGPEGTETIVACATSKKDTILSEEEFTKQRGAFKSYAKNLRDFVVKTSKAIDGLEENVSWGTAEVTLTIGGAPEGGKITSNNVFVLGVGAPTMGLLYCNDDAQKFAQLVSEKMQVPAENTKLVLGPLATKEGFAQGLRWLAQKTQPRDLVFIYFSGHGTLVPDPPGVRHDDGLSAAFVCYHERKTLKRTDPDLDRVLFSGPHFAQLMKEVPARRRLIVVDSCHSGSITKAIGGNLVPKFIQLLSPEELMRLHKAGGRTVTTQSKSVGRYTDIVETKETLLAACAKPEASFEDRAKRSGLFTYWFLRSLEESGGDIRHAFLRARGSVVDETGKSGLQQTPQLTDEYNLAGDVKF